MMPRPQTRPRSLTGHRLEGINLVRIAYLDEAGISNQAQEPYLVVAAVVLHGDNDWPLIRNYLHVLADEYGLKTITKFHAKDIFHGTGVFDRNDKNWPNERRRELLLKLASLPALAKLPVAVGYVHRPTFKIAVDTQFDKFDRASKQKLKRPNLLYGAHLEAFVRAAKAIDTWMEKNAPSERAMLIAENTAQMRRDIKLVHAVSQDYTTGVEFFSTEAFKTNRLIETVHFAEKKESPLLQLADVCAFVTKRQLMKKADVADFYKAIEPQIIRLRRRSSSLLNDHYRERLS